MNIKRVLNGWVLTEGENVHIVEQRDGESGVRAGERLLWFIIDCLGLGGDRYDEERITIGLEPGDKYHEVSEGPEISPPA